jgi:hypothetical protein
VQINITFDSSVANAPDGFTQTVLSVANFYAAKFGDASTLNLNVGFGEVAGSTLPSGALGASSTYLASLGYSTLVSALKGDASSAADSSAIASLGRDPTGGMGHYWISTAEAKALGFSVGSGSDGSIGFSSTAKFSYDPTHGQPVPAGTYDFYATVAHEFSEVMGRMLLAGERIGSYRNSYSALDLFHYASRGHRDLSGTQAGYFSVDGGVTNLHNFNTNPSGDFGDWASSGNSPADSFNAFASSGVNEPISTADITALDAIGWSLAGTTSANGTLNSGVGKVSYTQQVAGAQDVSGLPGHADLHAADVLASLGVGQGLFGGQAHFQTDLSFYYGA